MGEAYKFMMLPASSRPSGIVPLVDDCLLTTYALCIISTCVCTDYLLAALLSSNCVKNNALATMLLYYILHGLLCCVKYAEALCTDSLGL